MGAWLRASVLVLRRLEPDLAALVRKGENPLLTVRDLSPELRALSRGRPAWIGSSPCWLKVTQS